MGMQPVVVYLFTSQGKENYYCLCPQSQSGHSAPELLSTSINQLIKMQSEINMGTIIISCPYLWESDEEVEECQVCCVDEEDNNCKFEAHLHLSSSLNSNGEERAGEKDNRSASNVFIVGDKTVSGGDPECVCRTPYTSTFSVSGWMATGWYFQRIT